MTTPNHNILGIISKKYIDIEVDKRLSKIYSYFISIREHPHYGECSNPIVHEILLCDNVNDLKLNIFYNNLDILLSNFMSICIHDKILRKYIDPKVITLCKKQCNNDDDDDDNDYDNNIDETINDIYHYNNKNFYEEWINNIEPLDKKYIDNLVINMFFETGINTWTSEYLIYWIKYGEKNE